MPYLCEYPILAFYETFARNSCGGITVMETLKELQEHYKGTDMEPVMDSLIEDITNGVSLSPAMRKHPEVFGKHVTAFVEGGERAGVIEKAFLIIVEQAWRCPLCILTKPKTA